MNEELQHEIACLMAHTSVSREAVETYYGADVVASVWNGIAFRRDCMKEEISAVRMFVPESPMANETIAQAHRRASFCLVMLYLRSWYPTGIEHLRYLLWRAALARNAEYKDEIDAELAARISASEAAEAVNNLLKSVR